MLTWMRILRTAQFAILNLGLFLLSFQKFTGEQYRQCRNGMLAATHSALTWSTIPRQSIGCLGGSMHFESWWQHFLLACWQFLEANSSQSGLQDCTGPVHGSAGHIYICPGKESSAHLSPNTFADKPERRQVTKCNCWCKDPRDTQMHSTNTGQAWKPLQRRDVTKAIQSTCFLFTFPSSLHEPKSPNIQCGAASASTFGFTLSWAPETAVNEGYAQRARIACCNLGSQDQWDLRFSE